MFHVSGTKDVLPIITGMHFTTCQSMCGVYFAILSNCYERLVQLRIITCDSCKVSSNWSSFKNFFTVKHFATN